MKITLISLDNWGFNQHIANTLITEGHTVHHINFDSFLYKYPNFFYKIYNFFLKLIFRKNLKHLYYGKEILKRLENLEKQDVILTLKGDFIASESIRDFKKYTDRSIAFFNDNILRYPNIENVLPLFDEVYSFEKRDCEKFNLKFKTNFIYNSKISKNTTFKYQLFNISSRDKRTTTILDIAKYLKENNILSKIIILDNKNKMKDSTIVDVIRKPIDLNEVNQYIENSKILLDIHREKQSGLSFRVFESLGLQKKLITTNQDIKTYDFYNPNNILVIDSKNLTLSKLFFETDYEEVPSNVLNKYFIENWIEEIIN